MFSGLVAAVGSVSRSQTRGSGARLEIAGAPAGEPLALGESIAVNGACLTVSALKRGGFAADLSPETLSRTTLGRLNAGDKVNLERSLRLADRLGGHLVLGHVDATTRVVAVRPSTGFVVMRFALPGALATEVAEKGSIAVDGVSLTVSALGDGWFEAALIPATLDATTLAQRRPGDEVNLETDILAKYVLRALGKGRRGLESLLQEFQRASD